MCFGFGIFQLYIALVHCQAHCSLLVDVLVILVLIAGTEAQSLLSSYTGGAFGLHYLHL
jgi:hypothetical protein